MANGNEVMQIYPGISMMRFTSEYRKALDKAIEKWEEYKKSLPFPPKDEVYSFAYWLFRYSGLIKPD